jgi:hypothetical protein
MRTARGTHRKAHIFLVALPFVVAAVLPLHWRAGVARAWSFAVYYLGYRLLSAHVSCGNLAVSGVPFVMKYGA